MPHLTANELRRPYLVIPKLIKQPTWGGSYIVEAKGWSDHEGLGDLKIGQSYELFSGSNLSLLTSTDDPFFKGELTDNAGVAIPTSPPHAIPLSRFLETDVVATLGRERSQTHSGKLDLLLKFTQALGNSFQAHISADLQHPKWLPKPESWYYFEPGLITLGVKPDADWQLYEATVRTVAAGMTRLGDQVKAGTLDYYEAQDSIKQLLRDRDPWQFVNTVATKAGDIVDLSSGGLHHSWEEDSATAPLGNVLYELQSEALDAISTFRSFDKGKMSSDGSIRPIQIDEYFEFINRQPEVNDPTSHLVQPHELTHTQAFRLERLMDNRFYSLDRLTLKTEGAQFKDDITSFRHVFVKSGAVTVESNDHTVTVGSGHSAFLPAAAHVYTVTAAAPECEVLISY